jgi:hypothetical protein
MLVTSRGRGPRLLLFLVLPLLALSARAADDKPAAAPPRGPAAVCVSDTASLLRREGDKPWQVVKEHEELMTGDLYIGGNAAAVDSKDGGVRLIVVGDLDAISPLAILESAFVLNPAKDVDLDVTVERGRIRLLNLKKEGPAKVRVHVRQRNVEVTLNEPGATLSVEIYGRWPRGVAFSKEPRPGEQPAILFTVLAIKGDIDLQGPNRHLQLRSPPGPALLEGDSLGDPEPAVAFLKELPPWAPERLADLGHSERGQKVQAIVAAWRKDAAEKGFAQAVEDLLHSDDPMARRLGIILLAATDNHDRIGELLKTTTHQDVWDTTIIVMRNWIGRGPGQDQKLYQVLVEKNKIPPKEAEGILQLLHSFGDEELSHPEIYEVLINYLGSERTSLRQLAYWHLQRLVPAGRKIAYEPLAPKEKRDAAVKEWRKLIPPGQMPPKSGGE